MWPDRRIIDLFGIELPILQAPMAGSSDATLAIAVCEAGGLGALPCAMFTPDQFRTQMGIIRQRTARPVNVNFFCHRPPLSDAAREATWRRRLASYYAEFGIDPATIPVGPGRAPFDAAFCDLVVELRPEVVSFHFGLPDKMLLRRVRDTGAKIMSSATTVEEARWLEGEGCDAIIAQGCEAGGHRGMFLTDDTSAQPGTFSLVPQIADAVSVPVIAAGGIADARTMVAALVLGAAAVQVGTAYLRCPESLIHTLYREALRHARDDATVLTNVFTGRPARGLLNRFIREVGPMNAEAPAFPLATGAIAPLRAQSEAAGKEDFSPLWAGQSAALAPEMPAAAFTRTLAEEAAGLLSRLSRC